MAERSLSKIFDAKKSSSGEGRDYFISSKKMEKSLKNQQTTTGYIYLTEDGTFEEIGLGAVVFVQQTHRVGHHFVVFIVGQILKITSCTYIIQYPNFFSNKM